MSLLDRAIKHKLSTTKSGDDGTGVMTVVDEKRKTNNTLRTRSVLSNKVNGKYTTRTVSSYAYDGITIESTIVYALTYNSTGGVVSEIVQ